MHLSFLGNQLISYFCWDPELTSILESFTLFRNHTTKRNGIIERTKRFGEINWNNGTHMMIIYETQKRRKNKNVARRKEN